MKQYLYLILFVLLGALFTPSYAQLFDHKKVLDKFDDVISDKRQKTWFSLTDSTIVIEEKGKKPVTYIIQNYADYNSMGSKTNPVNLIQRVYGYQDCWCVVHIDEIEKYTKAYLACLFEEDKEKRNEMIDKMVDKYCWFITHRVITNQYTKEYENEYFWISQDDGKGRTVYYNK